MLRYNQYVMAASLEEAYELCQKKNNIVLGGNLWTRMQNKTYGAAIDLSNLGLNYINEDVDCYSIGAYTTLRELELHEGLNKYTNHAIEEAVKHIVGVQFRNLATLGGSIYGRFGFSDVYTIFMALNAKVELFHRGIMSLSEFAKLPKTERDILIRVIVPKNIKNIVYLSQRNSATDFPVLSCAVSKNAAGFKAVIGATPYLAQEVFDEEYLLSDSFGWKREERMPNIEAFASYTAERIRFDSNMRASAEYRRKICAVLIKRALVQIMEAKEV